jgi:hypothetical protein
MTSPVKEWVNGVMRVPCQGMGEWCHAMHPFVCPTLGVQGCGYVHAEGTGSIAQALSSTTSAVMDKPACRLAAGASMLTRNKT